MNYLKIYCNLIRKAENRTPPESYTEKHHIFPKSIFGNNNKLVLLTAREHYIAHALLEKIYIKRYGVDHWKTIKMTLAHSGMKGNGGYVNSYLYEGARKRRSEAMRGNKNGLGVKRAEKQKQMTSIRTKELWKNGIFSTPEYRETLSKSLCKKQYKIIDNEKNIYYIDNVIKFSKENNLDYSAMYKIVSGKLKSYKGWTGEII